MIAETIKKIRRAYLRRRLIDIIKKGDKVSALLRKLNEGGI